MSNGGFSPTIPLLCTTAIDILPHSSQPHDNSAGRQRAEYFIFWRTLFCSGRDASSIFREEGCAEREETVERKGAASDSRYPEQGAFESIEQNQVESHSVALPPTPRSAHNTLHPSYVLYSQFQPRLIPIYHNEIIESRRIHSERTAVGRTSTKEVGQATEHLGELFGVGFED